MEPAAAGIDPVWLDRSDELAEATWTAPDRIRMTSREGRILEVVIAPDGSPGRIATAGS